jgi:hypothetical protein
MLPHNPQHGPVVRNDETTGNIPASLTAILRGGLGNQMFQYAMARSLALRYKTELRLDVFSEFWLDRQYRRSFALAAIIAPWRRASSIQVARWLLTRASCGLSRRLGHPTNTFDQRHCGRVLMEATSDRASPLPPLTAEPWTLFGYWQSPTYFEEHAQQIATDLMPPVPTDAAFVAAREAITNRRTVAIGLRLYEESKFPSSHARDGCLKSTKELAGVIKTMRRQCPDAKFIFFCSTIPADYETLGLPNDTLIATPQTGFGCPLGSLWLMSQCKHHILTNSTLYWWGAWLSQWANHREPQMIFAADNFRNCDALPPTWIRF